MNLSGECVIAAPVAQVWAALNDPHTLRTCIRGCVELIRVSETEITALISRKVGSLDASFVGRLELTGTEAPNSCSVTCQWSRGAFDPAGASAQVRLAEVDCGTRLIYTLDTGSEISQVAQGIAETEAKQFLASFAEIVGQRWIVGIPTSGRPDPNLVRWAELIFWSAGATRPRAPAWLATFSPWFTGRWRR